VFAYYQGTGSRTSAIDQDLMRDLIEHSFIEEYHWTPTYIQSLPYKWIQKHLSIKKAKRGAAETHASVEKFKAQQGQFRQSKKMYKSV